VLGRRTSDATRARGLADLVGIESLFRIPGENLGDNRTI
jgi:hypothetical protein